LETAAGSLKSDSFTFLYKKLGKKSKKLKPNPVAGASKVPPVPDANNRGDICATFSNTEREYRCMRVPRMTMTARKLTRTFPASHA
jgi:hypothetical protein